MDSAEGSLAARERQRNGVLEKDKPTVWTRRTERRDESGGS